MAGASIATRNTRPTLQLDRYSPCHGNLMESDGAAREPLPPGHHPHEHPSRFLEQRVRAPLRENMLLPRSEIQPFDVELLERLFRYHILDVIDVA